MNHILTENNEEPTISVNQLNAMIDLLVSTNPSDKSKYVYHNDVIVASAVKYMNNHLRKGIRTYETLRCDGNIIHNDVATTQKMSLVTATINEVLNYLEKENEVLKKTNVQLQNLLLDLDQDYVQAMKELNTFYSNNSMLKFLD